MKDCGRLQSMGHMKSGHISPQVCSVNYVISLSYDGVVSILWVDC